MTPQVNSESWAFSEPPALEIAVARTVLSGEDPVYCIQHTKNGRWWFFGSPAKFPASRDPGRWAADGATGDAKNGGQKLTLS